MMNRSLINRISLNAQLVCPAVLAAACLALPQSVAAQTVPSGSASTASKETALAAPPEGAPPAPPASNYRTQYNGFVDGYYLFQFRNPKDVPTISGRVYDVRNDSPALSMAELNVFQNPRPHSLGFKVTLVAGDATDVNHYDFGGASGGKGEARFKNLQQLYGSYSFGTDGSGVDFGKLVTPFGYEQIEATGNYKYSHSVPFGLEPTYQFGCRIYTPTHALGINGLTATAYLTNAIYNTQAAGVQDDNKQPAYIGQLSYADPKGRLTVTSTLGLAKDKFDITAFSRTDANARITLNDNAITYALSSTKGLGLNYVYAKFEPNGGPRITLNAVAMYYHQALTPKTGLAIRFSGSDTRTDGVEFQPKPYEVTATYQIKPTANFTTFLEYRHDGTNVPDSFLDSDSQLTQKTQDTFTVGGIFQF